MYLDYYGFTEKPFSITPNPRFIFFSKIHKEAFALLLYGIDKRFGFIELIGEVGTGKTLMVGWATAQVFKPIVRCAATHVDPTTAERDLDIVLR